MLRSFDTVVVFIDHILNHHKPVVVVVVVIIVIIYTDWDDPRWDRFTGLDVHYGDYAAFTSSSWG